MQAQQDAINLVCHSKTRSNPENNVGLISLAKYVDFTYGIFLFSINSSWDLVITDTLD